MAAFDALFSTLLIFAVILHRHIVQADRLCENGLCVGYSHQNQLNVYTIDLVCPRIVSRLSWNAVEPSETTLFSNVPEYVVICHTVTPECRNETSCSARVRSIQMYHMDQLHFPNIAYNFLIGGDGVVYEGRGWDHVGNAGNHNGTALSIGIIGDFGGHVPDSIVLDVTKKLITCGVSNGKVSHNYKLVGHRQVSNTISPGEKLFEEIKTWPRWTANLN